MPRFLHLPTAALLLLVLAAATARAETGVDMLLSEWDWAGKQTAALDAWGGRCATQEKGSEADISIRYTEIQGRVHTQDMPLMVGWQGKFTGFGSADRTGTPEIMRDLAFSCATSLTPNEPAQAFGRDWSIAVEAGAGHASTDFQDGRGLYATGTLTASTDFSETARLTVGASYDGNRSLAPDLPLAGFEYRDSTGEYIHGDKKKPVFVWRVGFPRLGFDWRPSDRWLISLKADITSLGAALVEYQVTDKWYALCQFRPYRIRAHADQDAPHRRLFFSSDTLECGARFTPRTGIHLLGAVGYSFNQVLERGWDTRDLQTVREFQPAPMMRGEFRWDF